MKKNKKIYLTESQIQSLKEANIIIDPNKMRVIVKFLDDNFLKGDMPMLGADGYPSKMNLVVMKGYDGKPMKYMTDKQLFYMLQDKFKNIINDMATRDKVLKHVMIDWYNGKIDRNSMTSRNAIDEEFTEEMKIKEKRHGKFQ